MLFNCNIHLAIGSIVASYICINGHEWATDGTRFYAGGNIRANNSESIEINTTGKLCGRLI